jgi:hypothetical protein
MQAAIQRLTMSKKKAVFALRCRCVELRIFDLALQCQLFDALVKPMLNYVCEVLSDHMARKQLEVVHWAFLKLSLGQHHDIQLRRAGKVWHVSPRNILVATNHVLASSSWLKGNTLYTIKWLQLTPAR